MPDQILIDGKPYIQDRFTTKLDGMSYTDAIVLPVDEYNALTPSDLQKLKDRRHENWRFSINQDISTPVESTRKVWPGLGVNYKTFDPKMNAWDAKYFKSIGLQNLRIHIPGYTSSPASLVSMENTAKFFKDQGFYVVFGLTCGGYINRPTFINSYVPTVIDYAKRCHDLGLCNEFQVGNEETLHQHWRVDYGVGANRGCSMVRNKNVVTVVTNTPHGYTTDDPVYCDVAGSFTISRGTKMTVVNATTFTFPQSGPDATATIGRVGGYEPEKLVQDIFDLAGEVKKVFTGLVSYAAVGSREARLGSHLFGIHGDTGELDILGVNVYGNVVRTSNKVTGLTKNYIATIDDIISLWPLDKLNVSEFNVEAGVTNFNDVPDSILASELQAEYTFLRSKNIPKCYLYQYCAYRDDNVNDSFWVAFPDRNRYTEGNFRPAWKVLIP